MSSPAAISECVNAEKYVPVHKRSSGPTSSSPTRQTLVLDEGRRLPAPVYSIAELLQLSKSSLVQTSLTSEQKTGIADVMAYIPQSQRRTKSRSPSPTESNRSSSPTSKSKKTSSPTKKARKSPAPENVSLPKVDTPSTPRRRSSKRRPAEPSSNSSPDSGHQHHRRKQWGYAPSLHCNEDNWRTHPSVIIAA